MRVAFLIYSLGRGGAERATVNLANYLVSIGWDVEVFTLLGEHEPAYAVSELVKVRSLGVNTISKSVLDGALSNIKRSLTVRRLVKKGNIDCLIGMGFTAGVLAGISCLALTSCAIGSERSHPVNKPITLTWKLTRKLAYRLLDSIVCLTSETQEWLYANTYARRVVLIPNGIDYPLQDGKPVVELPQNTSQKYILGVGRLIDTKQFDQLISAFGQLAILHPDWDLVILGDGPEKQQLTSLVAGSDLEGRIHLPGAVGNLDYWYKACDVFVSTSRHEGFPNSVLEAMAYGLPTIAYDCPTGPRDLIDHNKNGFLLKVSDVSALVDALQELIESSAQRQAMATSAGELKLELSMDKIGERWANEIIGLTSS